jgi:hypothetical protein
MHWLPLTPGNILGTHFCQMLRRTQGHSAAKIIKSTKNSNDLIGNRTHNLPDCSTMPQSTAPCTPFWDTRPWNLAESYYITWCYIPEDYILHKTTYPSHSWKLGHELLRALLNKSWLWNRECAGKIALKFINELLIIIVVHLTQLSIVHHETHIKESNITQFCKNLK